MEDKTKKVSKGLLQSDDLYQVPYLVISRGMFLVFKLFAFTLLFNNVAVYFGDQCVSA